MTDLHITVESIEASDYQSLSDVLRKLANVIDRWRSTCDCEWQRDYPGSFGAEIDRIIRDGAGFAKMIMVVEEN